MSKIYQMTIKIPKCSTPRPVKIYQVFDTKKATGNPAFISVGFLSSPNPEPVL
jgi:hypothetical protein